MSTWFLPVAQNNQAARMRRQGWLEAAGVRGGCVLPGTAARMPGRGGAGPHCGGGAGPGGGGREGRKGHPPMVLRKPSMPLDRSMLAALAQAMARRPPRSSTCAPHGAHMQLATAPGACLRPSSGRPVAGASVIDM